MPSVRWKLPCSWLTKLKMDIIRAKRDFPILFEFVIALLVLCVLLLIDIVWLGSVHSSEINELDQLHGSDLDRFRKQFDVQMHAVQEKHERLGNDLEAAHAADVDKLKFSHQEELEKKISSIQDELKSLLGLSKVYWEKHAEKKHIDLDDSYGKIFEIKGDNGDNGT